MKKVLAIALLAAILSPSSLQACSCFGNNSYCETLSPGWFVNPDATALVVKLADYHYGITVKVVLTFGGTTLPNDTLTVWGDNGALCRIYVNGIAVGDTMVFGLNETDFTGNTIWNSQYPPNLEMPGDYMVSVCGVYALNYNNGMVNGWITAPAVQSMTLQDFDALVSGCTIGVGVEEEEASDPLLVKYDGGVPVLELTGDNTTAELRVFDARGQVALSRSGMRGPCRLNTLAVGSYLVDLRRDGKRWARKLVVLE